MRFLANENFPLMSVRYLRSAGYYLCISPDPAYLNLTGIKQPPIPNYFL